MGWGHHVWGFGGFGGWEMLFGVLMMLLFWGGLFAVLFFVVRAAVGGRRERHEPETGRKALGILAQRYAKGEISADEYREMKDVLEA